MRLIPQPPGKIVDGQVIFKGNDLLQYSDEDMRNIRGASIAMIFQDPMTSLNPVFTIGEQIAEALRQHMAMNDRQARNRTAELLDLVGIPDAHARLDSYPHEFSGGMRQRVMIAMGLSCAPQILIADEPTTALDVTIQAQILDLAKRLRDKLGMAMIWITHDLGIVAGLVDKVIVMYAGFIVEKADVDELYRNPRHPYTLGLLRSLPRVDKDRKVNERLIPIPGLPPNLIGLPDGCPFVARCPFSISRCTVDNPSLKQVGSGHEIACWVDVREAATHEVVV
jgi:oligopeptide transport system ATP-binding protein